MSRFALFFAAAVLFAFLAACGAAPTSVGSNQVSYTPKEEAQFGAAIKKCQEDHPGLPFDGVIWCRPMTSGAKSLALVPIVAATAAADDMTGIGVLDDPVALVVIGGLLTYAVYDANQETINSWLKDNGNEVFAAPVSKFETWVSLNKAKLMLPALVLQSAMAAQELAPTIEGNSWWSINHGESQRVIEALHMQKVNGKLNLPWIQTKGRCDDGAPKTNGTVCLFAGVNGSIATFSIVYIFGANVAYAATQTTVYTRSDPGFNPTFTQIPGTGYFYNSKATEWVCSWILTASKGKTTAPSSQWLDTGAGWLKWKEYQQKYNLYIQLTEIPLPPNPFK